MIFFIIYIEQVRLSGVKRRWESGGEGRDGGIGVGVTSPLSWKHHDLNYPVMASGECSVVNGMILTDQKKNVSKKKKK